MPNASPIEILWTIVASIGVCSTLYGVWLAGRDWRKHRADELRLVASVLLAYEALLLIFGITFVVEGVRAILLPPRAGAIADGYAVAVAILAVLDCIALTAVSIFARWARRRNDRGGQA